MKIIHNTRQIVSLDFDSIYDFHDWLKAGEQPMKDVSLPDHGLKNNGTAGNSMTKAAAMAIADRGGYWPEGAEKIKPLALALDQISASDLSMPRPRLSVVGYRPSVPAYLSGSPRAMWSRPKNPVPDRMIRIAVDMSCISRIEPEHFNNRGNAILSAIDSIESAGFTTELTACWRAQDDANQFNLNIPVKQGDRPWDVNAVAFTLGNVDFGRRLCFTAYSVAGATLGRESWARDFLNSGLGTIRDNAYEDFDISFEGMKKPYGYTSPEEALETVTKKFADFLASKAAA